MNKTVQAIRVTEDRLPAAPGEYRVHCDAEARPCRLTFACPCGCGDIGGVTLKPSEPNGWDFNGDVNKPTCSPSIRFLSGCQWHGYLRDGVFETC